MKLFHATLHILSAKKFISYMKAQKREQILVPDLYVPTVESVASKKRLKREKIIKKKLQKLYLLRYIKKSKK